MYISKNEGTDHRVEKIKEEKFDKSSKLQNFKGTLVFAFWGPLEKSYANQTMLFSMGKHTFV